MIKKSKIYVYPITARGKDEASNPYIYNLVNSLGVNFSVINKDDPSSNGIVQLFKYAFKADIFYFNWIENLPSRKAGILQTGLLMILLYFLKLSGKKIIWTMHNKISHSSSRLIIKKYLFTKLLKLSNLVITHSSEGISYGQSIVDKNNVWYFPHPVLLTKSQPSATVDLHKKKYDVLIWGVMASYKSVDIFLKYIFERKSVDLKILIAGKFISDEYLQEVNKYKTDNIEIINDFIDVSDLKNYMNHAEVVLFTYQNSSVLSSGALMDTLTNYATVIGPEVGSFKDMAHEGLLFSYSDFDHLISLLNDVLKEKKKIEKRYIKDFLAKITWEQFALSFERQLHQLP